MRKDKCKNDRLYFSFTSLSSNNTYSLRDANHNENEIHYNVKERQTPESSADFSFCFWKGCGGSGGGAILCENHVSSSLSITSCIFLSCTCSDTNGGAIYAREVSAFHCVTSFFHDCHSSKNDGGAIEALIITHCNIISYCDFMNNTAILYGGSLVVANIKTTNCDNCFPAVVSECKFVANSAAEGGGLHMRPCIDAHYICDSLISSNRGTVGGGLQFWNDVIQSVSSPSFSFLFFSGNSATKGNDIIINGTNIFSAQSFIHCFTTTLTNRIYPSGNDNWLPLASFHFHLPKIYHLTIITLHYN